MSRQMRDFAAYFMQGLQLGGSWADKYEARQIEKEKSRLKAQQDKIRNAREDRKALAYEHGVVAKAESDRARAFRTMNPIPKGGGKADPLDNPGMTPLEKRWADRDAATGRNFAPAPAPAARAQQNISITTEGGDTSSGPVEQPPGGEVVVEAKGGKVPKMAGGGFVDSFNAGLRSGAAAAGKKKNDGSITEDWGKNKRVPGEIKKTGAIDVTPPGTLSPQEDNSDYLVRGFAEGGAVPDDSEGFDYEKALNDLEVGLAQVQARPTMQPAQPGYGGYDAGSANAATGNTSGSVGGDTSGSEAGVGGSGGVGGSASSDAGVGGSAAAGVGGDDGGTYKRGGRVRKFQSGGRVMEQAIDTGTSGPGSGYGYRAAPPARSYYG